MFARHVLRLDGPFVDADIVDQAGPERAAIVLLAADGLENQEIAAEVGITRQKAGRWRRRYAERGLSGIEKDAPRPGRRPQIDEAQRAAVVRKTLRETPPGQTHWSRTTMAEATGLSPSTIGRIWREHGLKPHLIETFKLSNDPLDRIGERHSRPGQTGPGQAA